jgi:hypothetical protein
METEEIKTAVEAARHREQQRAAGEPLGCPCCGGAVSPWRGLCECGNELCPVTHVHFTEDWNTRPAQEQADRALIALVDRLQDVAEQWSETIEHARYFKAQAEVKEIEEFPGHSALVAFAELIDIKQGENR